MTKLRGFIPTMTLMAVMVFGSSVANAGILINSRAEAASETTEPCTGDTELGLGSILNALAGILINSKAGILINSTPDPQETCGILINS